MKIEDYLDSEGNITLAEGVTLTSYLDHNIAELGETTSYRHLDYDHDGRAVELTWPQLGARLRAVGARLQQVTRPGDRVAILAPQGVDYVVGFFAAIQAGNIAVPLFAPELPGHAERLDAVLSDARPSVVLTTTAAAESVGDFLCKLPRQRRPRVIAVDAVPDSVGATFAPQQVDTDDIAYLQYTSGSTRTPAGVEISHRSACTNVLQMITSALCGGHITLMSRVAFVRRPHRWISELAAESANGRTFAAAPRSAESGPAPATWGCTSTASCTSPAGSRTWSSSTAATTTPRTWRRRRRRLHRRCAPVSSRRSRCRARVTPASAW